MSTQAPTKREARNEAASVLRNGYFRPRNANPYLHCRRCRREVSVELVAWATEKQVCMALRDALADHIYEGCDQ